MPESKPFVFVLMPFNAAFNDVYRLGIKSAAEKVGLRAERVDEQMYSESMLERIYQQIKAADIIVADMTGQNANVFYEVGYAHALNKLCVLLTQNASDIPFDLKQHRHIVYGGSVHTLQTTLEENLRWASAQVSTAKTSGLTVRVDLKSGDLTRTSYEARATVRFVVDIHNNADTPFGEIESINIYCGKGWEYSQSGQVAPRTASDVPTFAERHSFGPPMRRINPKGWTQLNFVGTKTLQTIFDGGELKDAYKLTGRVMVRLVTAARSYDFESTITVEVDDLPF